MQELWDNEEKELLESTRSLWENPDIAPYKVASDLRAKGGYGLALKFRKDKDNNTLADLYLADQYSTYRMGTFYTYGNTQIDLLRRAERYFDNSVGIANPKAVYPNLWSSLERIIMR